MPDGAKGCIALINSNEIYILFFRLDIHDLTKLKFDISLFNPEKQELLHKLKFKSTMSQREISIQPMRIRKKNGNTKF
jgi:hypothetical protein